MVAMGRGGVEAPARRRHGRGRAPRGDLEHARDAHHEEASRVSRRDSRMPVLHRPPAAGARGPSRRLGRTSSGRSAQPGRRRTVIASPKPPSASGRRRTSARRARRRRPRSRRQRGEQLGRHRRAPAAAARHQPAVAAVGVVDRRDRRRGAGRARSRRGSRPGRAARCGRRRRRTRPRRRSRRRRRRSSSRRSGRTRRSARLAQALGHEVERALGDVDEHEALAPRREQHAPAPAARPDLDDGPARRDRGEQDLVDERLLPALRSVHSSPICDQSQRFHRRRFSSEELSVHARWAGPRTPRAPSMSSIVSSMRSPTRRAVRRAASAARCRGPNRRHAVGRGRGEGRSGSTTRDGSGPLGGPPAAAQAGLRARGARRGGGRGVRRGAWCRRCSPPGWRRGGGRRGGRGRRGRVAGVAVVDALAAGLWPSRPSCSSRRLWPLVVVFGVVFFARRRRRPSRPERWPRRPS